MAGDGLPAARKRLAGARVLRIAFGWDAIEPGRGHYDWSFWDDFVRMAVDEFGIKLIPYVCYTPQWAASDDGADFWRSPPRDPEDFARFMTTIVGRYKHAIHSWELWNEPDNRAYWLGTREQFATLVRAGSRAVRAADPQATVVLGGIATETDFLEGLFLTDGIAPAVDVVNLHSYFETWHPDAIETLPAYVSRAAEIVREHGENEPLWMAETGYSSVGGRAVVSEVYRARYHGEHTAEAQAAALAKTFVLALATGELPLVAWYRINDLPTSEEVIGDDNNRHLGVRGKDGAEKPALTTFTLLTRWFQQPYRILTPVVRSLTTDDSPVEVHAFALRDGRQLIAVWLGTPETPADGANATTSTKLVEDTRLTRVHVSLPKVRATSVRITDATGKPPGSDRLRWRNTRNAVELDLQLRGGGLLFCELQP
ncbi:MAG: hypothetical protein K0R17_1886 [Rariglobus sp.]|nr:hypothetical protein [Rariglobus sp.]